MRSRMTVGIGICSIAILMASVPGLCQAQKPRIKVTVENANIRIKPDVVSDIIANAALGSVYDVEAKIGEWYEVKHRTNIGVLVTGYIHDIYVELEKTPEEKTTAKKAPENVPPLPAREPAASERPGPSPGIRLGFKLSAIAASWSGYDYEYNMTLYDENLKITDSVDNSFAVGLNVEVCVFLAKNIELTGGVNILSKKASGHYGFALPNIYIYNDIATDEAVANPKRLAMEAEFGLNYHIVTAGALTPYVGLGAAYVMAKMDLLEDIAYQETFLSNSKHTIKLTEVKLTEKKVNKFGFFGRAGLNVAIGRNLAVFLEGKYVLAKTDVPHPLTSVLDANEKLNLDLGGPAGRIGLRVLL